MCSGTYYLIIGALSLPTSIRSASVARYGIIFPLHYKHEWNPSYTYRILICPKDESLEQRKRNKTKTQHFSCCEQWLCRSEPEDLKILFSTTPQRGHATPLRGPSLRRGVPSPRRRTPDLAQSFAHLVHFSRNPTKNKGKLMYYTEKHLPNVF